MNCIAIDIMEASDGRLSFRLTVKRVSECCWIVVDAGLAKAVAPMLASYVSWTLVDGAAGEWRRRRILLFQLK